MRWAQRSLLFVAAGAAATPVATPLISPLIFDKWFSFPNIILLLPIPAATAVLFAVMHRSPARMPVRLAQGNEYGAWVPFATTVGVFLLTFYGLAYSLFPWLVIDQIHIWQAITSPEAMKVIFTDAAVKLPLIVGYTVLAYRVFWGKRVALSY